MKIRVVAVSAAMLVAAAGAVAQDKPTPRTTPPAAPTQAAAPTLKVGDKAPALSADTFVKGAKVEKFEEGKVYVIDFWATWCPPCRESIPHLTDLQKKYKDQGLTVIAVSSRDRNGESLDKVKKFVESKGKAMEYTVAFDDDQSMVKTWTRAAGLSGIPAAFIVDHTGKIAFMGVGYPMAGFDEALEKAVKANKRAAMDAPAAIVPASFEQPAATEGKDAKADKKPEAKKESADAGPSLFVGDKAPALSVSKWVKGEPVTGFEKGKTYVVEFWATWCGPCRESIPHLTELAKKHKDVPFVGVSVWETNTADVEPFVKEMGDKMDYHIAMDNIPMAKEDTRQARTQASRNGDMSTTWMKASGAQGIPTAFVVHDGRIAWMGHPQFGLDETIDAIKAGKWDIDAQAAKAKKEADVSKQTRPLMSEYQRAAQAGDWDKALAALDKLIALDAKSAGPQLEKYRILLTETKDFAKAFALGNEIVDGVAKDDPQALNQIAWMIVDPESEIATRDLKLAAKAAQRATDLTKSQDPAILDTLAKVTFDSGDKAKAIELQTKAVELVKKDPKFKMMEQELVDRLEEFKKSK